MNRALSTFWLCIATVLLLSGCASAPKRELSTSLSRFVMLPNGQNPLNPGQTSEVRKALRDAAEIANARRAGTPLRLLELSGGAQNGAFGAGVLHGWVEANGPLDLDLVTGVSTGTLLDTFAFLGTPADIENISKIYLNIKQQDIYTKRSILAVLTGSNSIFDSAPFERTIAKTITQEVLDRIAAKYDEGRRLLCATTNLDYKQTWVWDLTAIAKHGGAGALDLYRSVVRASASPPIMFQPVEIDGSLFADGGTRHNLLLGGLVNHIAEDNKTAGRVTDAKVYVIMNDGGRHQQTAVSDDIKDLIPRSVNMMVGVSTADSVLRAYFITQAHGFDFNLVSIPNDVPIGDNSMAFDHAVMQTIFVSGKTVGHDGSWQKRPTPVTPDMESNATGRLLQGTRT